MGVKPGVEPLEAVVGVEMEAGVEVEMEDI